MVQTKISFINPVKKRWYRIDVGTDLFDTVVIRRWGAMGTGQGNDAVTVISSLESDDRIVAAETRRRVSRGYQCVLQPLSNT